MEGEEEDDSLLDDSSLLRMLKAFVEPGEGEEEVADRCACILWDICAGNPRQAGVLMQHGLMQALGKVRINWIEIVELSVCTIFFGARPCTLIRAYRYLHFIETFYSVGTLVCPSSIGDIHS